MNSLFGPAQGNRLGPVLNVEIPGLEVDVRTASFSIIRLHGPDRAGIEDRTGGKWNEIVGPKDNGLKTTAEIIRQNQKPDTKTYVNVNNHYEGCAPLTIQRLLNLLRNRSSK